jgi:2-hydroxychromene-2-carboxylate isomerase
MALEPPAGFPISSLLAMRALILINRANPDQLLPCSDALYAAIWGPDANKAQAHKPEGLAKVLTQVLGEAETQRVMQEMGSDANKKALTDSVNEAVGEGAFGMPYFVVTDADGKNEAYWGFNYMGMIVEHMGLKRADTESGWKAML